MSLKNKLEGIIYHLSPSKINNLANFAFLASICVYPLISQTYLAINPFYIGSLGVATKVGIYAEIDPLRKILFSSEL